MYKKIYMIRNNIRISCIIIETSCEDELQLFDVICDDTFSSSSNLGQSNASDSRFGNAVPWFPATNDTRPWIQVRP